MRTRSSNFNKIAQLLIWGSEQCHKMSDSPRLDAEILLTHVLNKPRSYCRTWPEKIISDKLIKDFEALISLRLAPTPVAYLIGYKEFWSRDFKVNRSTLIPRPDTELLIEQALNFLHVDERHKKVLDLGTGSGCIAITLQKECSNCKMTATDISPAALSLAQDNAQLHQAEVAFFTSSWFERLEENEFDLIVSNPPYIAQADEHLSQGDLPAEPLTALASGIDGLDDIKLITEQALTHLKRDGMLMIEHGYDQKVEVYALFKQHGYQHIQQYNDLGQQARLTSGIK